MSIASFWLGGVNAGLGYLYFNGLGILGVHYAWQIATLDIEDR